MKPVEVRIMASLKAGLIAASVSSVTLGQSPPPYFFQVSINDQANIQAQSILCPGFTNGALYPLGDAVYGGIPFRHGPADQYAFMGGPYCGKPPRSLELAFAAPGTSSIYTLLNSWGGCGTSGPEFSFRIHFADGTTSSLTLRNGVDYRDHNGSCPLAGIRSREVWTSGFGQRLDMLTVRVESPGKSISGIEIGSTDPSSRIAAPFVFGVTVADSEDCNRDGIADFGQIVESHLPDANSNGIPDGCECSSKPGLPACCVGNLNIDPAVDGADLGILLNAWGPCAVPCAADLNRDGFVNGADLGILLGNWGACP